MKAIPQSAGVSKWERIFKIFPFKISRIIGFRELDCTTLAA
jgi:hypothetical protein